MKSIKVVAVIPTFNRKNKLEIIVKQLFQQKLPIHIILYVVVVIDGSSDGTFEMIKNNYPTVHIILGNGQWWYTKSMNKGFEYSQNLDPDFILTMNDDIEIEDNYLSSLLSGFFLGNNPNKILGSLSISNDGQELILFAGCKKDGILSLSSKPNISALKEVYSSELTGIHESYVLPGRGILIPNKLFKIIGYFDNTLPQYGSDTDFCFRARKAGYSVMISWDAKVKVNLALTRIRSASKNESIFTFLKDIFDIHSHYSIVKFIKLEYRYSKFPLSIIWKVPFYISANIRQIIKYLPITGQMQK